ncbi:HAL/PAL/TAL family ammonia-lyase [Curtobacterium sp. RRHDQ66]|uniref:HAL/PAL/TAL family ammonia-lyase n=1 Tax=Curtobacterium guangdongense TaxID=3413380 RepID=UPI003BF073D9
MQPTDVHLDDAQLSIEQVVAVARHGAAVSFSAAYEARVDAAAALVTKFVADRRVVYGVTTGFGDNYTETISPEDTRRLQENIIVSHAVSVGAPIPDEQVRAILVTMLGHLGRGYSGTRLQTLELVRELLNRGVTPVVPGSGSLGYLALEAHIALVLIGRGRARFGGAVLPGADALHAAGLSPIRLEAKEGLTLLNGIMSVTGIAALAVHDATSALRHADVIGALSFEALRGTTRALDPRLHALRRAPEQQRSASTIARLLDGSSLAERHRDHRVQDPYLIRAMPQLHGSVARAFGDAATIVDEALGSLGDNPVLFGDGSGDGDAVMGGNFDATSIGLAMDSLKAAAAVLAHHSERRVDRMVNSTVSELPPFLAGNPGLDNGLMIPQYTAAALVMEIRGEASPATIDSIPTSAGQEDPISNAYLATQQATRTVDRLRYVLAIELLTAAQATDLLDSIDASSPALAAVRTRVRRDVPFAEHDRAFGEDIETLYALVCSDELIEITGTPTIGAP